MASRIGPAGCEGIDRAPDGYLARSNLGPHRAEEIASLAQWREIVKSTSA
jgi:hypothetical protein